MPDPEIDPHDDPAETLRKIQASRARVGCLGCVVTGAPAIAVAIGTVVLIVYLITRLV